MVDVAAPAAGNTDSAIGRVQPGFRASAFTGRDAARAYRDAAAGCVCSPSQCPDWIEAWATEAAPDLVVGILGDRDRAILVLALEVRAAGPVRVARFAGGSHANGNFPPLDAASAGSIDAGHLKRLFAAIARARPDIDLIALERLADAIEGHPNPFLRLPHRESPNLALAVDLAGGFEALLARASGKRKRKKHRSQCRKFEAAGGYRRREARTPGEVREMLDAFFAMKAARFSRMGIQDVFAEPQVRSFFRRLFTEALDRDQPPFVLHALEVGGRIRAVTGSSRCHRRLICEFGAIAQDELAGASPGEFLFFSNIEEACAQGYAVYDFSVGDDHYKRLWCDLEIRQFDVLVPLTFKGRVSALGLGMAAALKMRIKRNPYIWKLTKAFRKSRATAGPAPEE